MLYGARNYRPLIGTYSIKGQSVKWPGHEANCSHLALRFHNSIYEILVISSANSYVVEAPLNPLLANAVISSIIPAERSYW